jgi:peptide/nickel transport system substrate-binding protein
MVLAHREDPVARFDPMNTSSISLHQVSSGMYGSGNLVRPCLENVFELCPGLAESWEANKDYTQWTFKVRDNVVWHDGRPFTAEDAKFWLDLLSKGAESQGKKRRQADYWADFATVGSVEALTGNRLRFTLSQPNPNYLQVMKTPFYTIAHPKHLMESRIASGDVDVAPVDVGWVATGPFKMQNYENSIKVQLRRFDKYWEKDAKGRQLPYLDGVDFAIIRDPAAMDSAFRTGRVDGGARGPAFNLSKQRQAGYIRDLGDKVWFAEVPFIYSAFNFNVIKGGPLQDVRVRRAIALWADKQSAFEGVMGGFGDLYTIMAPKNPYTSPDFATWPGFSAQTRERDRAEAKRLLAEAGYAGGLEIKEQCWRVSQTACEFMQGQLSPLGVKLTFPRLLDTAGYSANTLLIEDDTNSSGGTRPGWVIPEQAEALLTRYSINKRAVIKHEDPKIPEYFTRLKGTFDPQERVKIYRELERYIVVDQVYYVPIFGYVAVTPYRSHVKGLVVPAAEVNSNYDFATVWLDK